VKVENQALVRRGTEVRVRTATEDRQGRLYRVLRAGICGTDLQICRGLRADAAQILGHEGLAVTLDAPAGLRPPCVVFNPVNPRDQDHILGHSHDGIFQSYFAATAEAHPETQPAPPGLVADLAPLVEPLAAVLYGWQLLQGAREVASAAVLGGGTTAALAVLVGELRGVHMTLVHARAARLAFLARVLDLGRTSFRSAPAPGHARVDAAFVCVPRDGAAGALSSALQLVRAGGVIDLLGGFGSGDRHPALGQLDLGAVRRANACGAPEPGRVFTAPPASVLVTGHRGTSTAHLLEAQRLLMAHPRRFAPLVTHVVSLTTAAAFLSAVSRGDPPRAFEGERLKVVIDLTLSGREAREPDLYTTVADAAGLS
jgi:2-epi-valiolone-7-phosphate 1-reductase